MKDIILELIAFFLGCITTFFYGYATRKEQNLATKQDIQEITRQVEGIKHEYELIRVQGEWEHQLRLAAIEKRLNTHQQAYSLLLKLYAVSTYQDQEQLFKDCDDFWRNNCLFLTPDARDKFNMAWEAAATIPDLYRTNPEEVIKKRDIIFRAIVTTVTDIQLRGIGEREIKNIILPTKRD
jgi:hypothetical protein